jgi:hypothetical protein
MLLFCMRTKSLIPLALAAYTAVSLAASTTDQTKSQLKIFPKNLARQHMGSSLSLFNPINRTYQLTEAAAAWLDADVTTGWPIMAGQQHYLLSLAEPVLLTNFAVSARPAVGTLTLYAGDEPAPPGAKSWSVLARNVSLESINERKLANPFNRFAKFVLIETDIADPGPLFSLYLYGDRPAISYQLRKRDTAIETRAIFGPYVNSAAACDLAALCAHARVSYANAPDDFVSWQKIIDENPESGINILPADDVAGMSITLDSNHKLSRLAVLAGNTAKGSIDFFVLPNVPPEGNPSGAATETEATKGDPVRTDARTNVASGALLAGMTPTITMALDGTTQRSSVEFPPVEGRVVLVRWKPATAGEALALRELNAFGDVALNEYELALAPDAIGERFAVIDGKDYKDFKGLPPVGEFITPRTPPIPGALGFPPNLTRRNPVSP